MKKMYLCLMFLMCLFLLFVMFSVQLLWSGGGKKGLIIKGKISGVVVDFILGEVVEFVILVLIKLVDGKQLDGGIIEVDGFFKIIEVDNGIYDFNVSFLGYEDKFLKGLEIIFEKLDLDLGIVYLLFIGVNLEEIMVIGEVLLVENCIDKLVYNVDKDVIIIGGDVVDVLCNVLLFLVDLDGNVSLCGFFNIQILINGWFFIMFVFNLVDVLKMILVN